jgi:hypothetical protein
MLQKQPPTLKREHLATKKPNKISADLCGSKSRTLVTSTIHDNKDFFPAFRFYLSEIYGKWRNRISRNITYLKGEELYL